MNLRQHSIFCDILNIFCYLYFKVKKADFPVLENLLVLLQRILNINVSESRCTFYSYTFLKYTAGGSTYSF